MTKQPSAYRSVHSLFSEIGAFHKDLPNWRLTPRVYGEVHALPHSHGLLAATNGILCYILRDGGQPPFLGHLDWFEPDKDTEIEELLALGEVGFKAKKANPVEKSLDELMNELA